MLEVKCKLRGAEIEGKKYISIESLDQMLQQIQQQNESGMEYSAHVDLLVEGLRKLLQEWAKD